MKIVIAHLYYDLLNLYGESGNVKIIEKLLKDQNIKVETKLLSIHDKLEFNKYDFIYIGSGTTYNQNLALNHIIKYKKEINKYIKNKGFILATGNAMELFGQYIEYINKTKQECLNIIPYKTKVENKRLVGENLMLDKENNYILGFQNQETSIRNNKHPLFKVIKGIGDYENSKYEGTKKNNFVATHLIGPFLIRNPLFTVKYLKLLIKTIDKDFKFKNFNVELESKATTEFIKNFYTDYYKK